MTFASLTIFATLAVMTPSGGDAGQEGISRDLLPEHSFTTGIEGPAVDRAGRLYAVNYRQNGTIGMVHRQGQAAIFATLPDGSIANGIRFDRKGNMFLADYAGHNILMIPAGSSTPRVFAHNPAFNQPNDIAITDEGILFASDPDWQNSTGQLWRITADGIVTLLETDMGTSNGIEVSPDNRTLYVSESVQRRIWAYDLDAVGGISNKRPLFQFAGHGLDGMRAARNGNLYIARYGAGEIAVLSPSGALLRTYALTGQKPTNVAFGGEDGRTLYVTMQDRGTIEFFSVPDVGRSFGLWPD